MAKPAGKEDRKTELEKGVLLYLDSHPEGIEDSLEYLKRSGAPAEEHEVLESVLRSLLGGAYITLVTVPHEQWTLTGEGKEYELKGSPEYQVFAAIGENGISREDLTKAVGKAFGIGFAHLMKQKLVAMDGPLIKRQVASIEDTTRTALSNLSKGNLGAVPADVLADLKRRKLIVSQKFNTYKVGKGTGFATERRIMHTDLTADMLKGGAWRTAQKDFKEYNFNALGAQPDVGCQHPLMKVRAQFRKMLIEMGFQEMPTDKWVESSFWNFDALFQPQQHPARDSHDTFFLIDPAETKFIPDEYMAKVKEMHEKGDGESIGYRYDWKVEEARKNILRTHTTAVSTRMLKKLGEQKEFKPVKYFSIDRVFRNETVDATHLAEFHQVEGLVADYNLTLGDLIGTIHTFFKKMGIEDVRFKPAYNPYTEPSMEIFGFSKQLNKWVEVGNSGMFRPEMLQPMGLPKDVRVIAWGLGLERQTLLKYGIRNIRDLFGHKVRLDIIHDNPLCRFDTSTGSAPQDEKEEASILH